MQNDFCPITLDPLSDKAAEEVFVHADVGFDMLALYEYLVQAPRFTNPVNRIPFTMQDLETLERQMETVFGRDCILYACDEADDEIALGGDGDRLEAEAGGGGDVAISQGGGVVDVDWLDDTELMSRLNTSITTVSTESNVRVIRLRVDIDLADAMAHDPSCLDAIEEEEEEKEEEEEEEEGEEDEFQNISPDALPPRRTFPSVTEMYRDTGRERRISERLALLQFLEYDAMNLLVQLMDMVYDDHFHRFVWQHTSLDVIDTVTTYLTDRDPSPNGNVFTHITEPSPHPNTPADYDLEVVYTECWEIYRQVLIHTLERRYAEAARDVWNLGANEGRALFACHRAYVGQKAREQGFGYEAVLDIVDRVEQGLFAPSRR